MFEDWHRRGQRSWPDYAAHLESENRELKADCDRWKMRIQKLEAALREVDRMVISNNVRHVAREALKGGPTR